VQLAEHLGFDRKRVEMLETAAVLHDIGKIGVSDHVLRKRGSLTPAERREVNNHAALGERILAGTSLHEVLPWILSHHERWDGTGYPTGLTGEEIPYEARILAVCDAFDAMTSDRPYRSALSCAAALQEIDLNMGTQFDPVIAEVFIRMVGRGQQATNEGLIASAELQQQA
jgi:HD-GYP domain-containing protein (c-di-GMP phosphodiesterase class II)